MSNIYQVTETDGTAREIIANQDFVEQYYPNRWVFLREEPPPPPPPNIITKVAFRFRLTDAEYTSILGAAKTDVEVAAWIETFNMVNQIDLDNQRTKDGVEKLVGKNLLTQARANEILTAPVQPGERP